MCYVSPVWSTGRFLAVLWVSYFEFGLPVILFDTCVQCTCNLMLSYACYGVVQKSYIFYLFWIISAVSQPTFRRLSAIWQLTHFSFRRGGGVCMWWAGGFSPLLEQLAQIPRGLSSLKPSPRISIPMENNNSVPCPGDHGKRSVTIFWLSENSREPIP